MKANNGGLRVIASGLALSALVYLVMDEVMFSKWDVTSSTQSADDDTAHMTSADESSPLVATRTCTQEERKQYVKAMCKKYKQKAFDPKEVEGANNLLVRDEHKIAWCRVAKAATSTINRLMMGAQKIPFINYDLGHPEVASVLKKYGLRMIFNQSISSFAGYKKVLVVRNPYERIVSAYRQKIESTEDGNPFMVGVREKLQRLQANNDKYVIKGKEYTTITYETFLTHIALRTSDPLSWDTHWTEYSKLCDVCADYDYILRVESLDTDVEILLKHLNISREFYSKYSINFSSQDFEQAVRKHKIQTSFSTDLNKRVRFSDVSLHGLKRRYGRDAVLFGYDIMPDSHVATCGIKTAAGDICC